MKKFGLIGYPLGHSFSKGYFTDKFSKEKIVDSVYENYPLECIEMITELVRREKNLLGLNITIPYKQKVISFLDEIDTGADEIGAVNCIRITRERENKIMLKGYNTDIYGFEMPLLEVLRPDHTKGLILGTGGASKAVAYILEKHHIEYRYVSRKPKSPEIFSYGDLTKEIIETHTIIVNTSPLGMHPNINTWPDIVYEGIGNKHILYDLVYNPERTVFLKKGDERGAKLINGLPMLYLQAEKSWEIWNAE